MPWKSGVVLSRASVNSIGPLFCTGISFKTQALYVVVFLTRYLDLFTHFVSIYNSVMKVFFIASSCHVLYLMKIKYRLAADRIILPDTNQSDLSTFQTNA
jgi:ER lumen protein retaining receptor